MVIARLKELWPNSLNCRLPPRTLIQGVRPIVLKRKWGTSGVFRNSKRGVHFSGYISSVLCTFSKVFKIRHNFFTTKYYNTLNSMVNL